MNRKAFYAAMRAGLGALDQPQVDGTNLILDEADRRHPPLHQLAYMLATAWWETGRTMQPVREAFYISASFAKAEAWRKLNLRYYPFYGRGLVQLTWEFNYRKASQKLGVDFVRDPDRVMEPAFAVAIMFDGMEEGWFTTKKLDDIIDEIDEPDSEDLREFVAARRIINGTDKATEIGKIALTFERALKVGGYSALAAPQPASPVPASPQPVIDAHPAAPADPESPQPGFWARLAAFFAKLFGG